MVYDWKNIRALYSRIRDKLFVKSECEKLSRKRFLERFSV